MLSLAAMVLAVLPGSPAAAADSCDRSGSTLTITTGESDKVVIHLRVLEGAQLGVFFSGAQHDCEGATNDNIQNIFVIGNPGNDLFVLDQWSPGGELNHGIQIDVDLGAGKNSFTIQGTRQRDRISIGTLRMDDGQVVDVVDRNGDGIPDVDLQDVHRFYRSPSGGSDIVSGMGLRGELPRAGASSASTLGPARIPLTLKGGPGNDKLTGGNAKDVVDGGSGNDKLKGNKGKDKLNGGKGTDKCNGGPGKDKERGCER